jgi:hypothetical protein
MSAGSLTTIYYCCTVLLTLARTIRTIRAKLQELLPLRPVRFTHPGDQGSVLGADALKDT